MVNTYIPHRGDIVWINFNPTRGHEQKGKRPALVLSPRSYNVKSQLMVVCPVTSQGKEYPFEVPFSGKKISGIILADQVKTVDWKERKVVFIEEVSGGVLEAVMHKLKLLLSL